MSLKYKWHYLYAVWPLVLSLIVLGIDTWASGMLSRLLKEFLVLLNFSGLAFYSTDWHKILIFNAAALVLLFSPVHIVCLFRLMNLERLDSLDGVLKSVIITLFVCSFAFWLMFLTPVESYSTRGQRALKGLVSNPIIFYFFYLAFYMFIDLMLAATLKLLLNKVRN